MKKEPNIAEIKSFWENNPLFKGESGYEFGTKEFFEEHRRVYLEDVFNNNIEKLKILPSLSEIGNLLDLGCGVGFWSVELQKRFFIKKFYACDLTETAVNATSKRLQLYSLDGNLSVQNGEQTNFKDGFFDFINCQGVIHHTENPEKMILEIHRILCEKGEVSISVYYKNFFIRNWHYFRIFGKIFYKIGIKFKGRGRESILSIKNTDEITKLYDGDQNPKGIAYSKSEIESILSKNFNIKECFLFYFPTRIFPISFPKPIHHFLSKYFGFMIGYKLSKK